MNTEIHQDAIARHYLHAMMKHPHFCDKMLDSFTAKYASGFLDCSRSLIQDDHVQYASNILECEIYEIYDALNREEREAAIEECYDAIAVLLRMVDDIRDGREVK